MRNCWLAAIAGHQGNAPRNISSEGLTGAEVPERSKSRATEHVGRGTRGRRGLVGQQAEAPIGGRGADGSRAAHGAARPHGRTRCRKARASKSNNQRHTATRSVL